MGALLKTLNDRNDQLHGRRRTIEAYLSHPNEGIGKQQYNEADLFIVDMEIAETDAAIKGIKTFYNQKDFASKWKRH